MFVNLRVLDGVALRKESVDRNYSARQKKIGRLLSLSARRAWIEIVGLTYDGLIASASLSARRAWIEMIYVTRLPRAQVSLSARRAWIEIIMFVNLRVLDGVALRKESVDRNYYSDKDADWVRGRSPQGERG